MLTQEFFYGSAMACMVGVAAGLWLEPPRPHVMERDSTEPVLVQPAAPERLDVASTTVGASAQWPQAVDSPAVQPDSRDDVRIVRTSTPALAEADADADLDPSPPPARMAESREPRPDYAREGADDDPRDAIELDDPPPPPPPPRYDLGPRWPSRDGDG
jgi:hypothetical protein